MYIYINICIYIYIYIYNIYIHYTHVITCRKLQLNKRGHCRRQTAERKCDTEQTIKLEWLYKAGSECELN